MNIHEYQAKELLAKRGVPVPAGAVAYTADEAVQAARGSAAPMAPGLGGQGADPCRRARQGGRDQAGALAGRGRGGGARADRQQAGDPSDRTRGAASSSASMSRPAVDIARELYLALSIDRATGRITLIGAGEGGMDIEELAAQSPEKIVRVAIDPASGLSPFHARRLAFAFGLSNRQVAAMVDFVGALYRAFSNSTPR